MVRHVAALHVRQRLVLRLVGEVLDAVDELVDAGRDQAGGEGRRRAADGAPQIAPMP